MIKLSVSTKGKTVGPQTDLIVEQGSGRIIFIRNSQCGPRVPFSPTSTLPPPLPPPPPSIFIRAPRETSPSSRTLREDFFPRYAQRQGGSRGRERERGLLLSVGSTALPPSPLSIYSAIIVNVPQRAVNEPTTTDRLAEGYRRVEHVFARWRRDLLGNPPNVCATRRGTRFLTRSSRRKDSTLEDLSVIFYRKIRSEL